ncbi:MAG TPA: hypothetical protein VEH27_10665 [Methylomirabilota bacterium]|nr:hypothetical protein [Methylomirabilota bacterium]
MRTKTLLLTAALCAAGVATSMAQGVFSVNTVGYVNVDVKPGFQLVANPLRNEGNMTVSQLFKNVQGGVPAGMQVFAFNGTSFQTATYDDLENNFLGSGANVVVEPGEGVFVRNPRNTDIRITFVGEVQTGTIQNPLPAGFSIKSSEVPIDGTATSLGFPGAAGDQIFKFNSTTQAYQTFNFDDLEGGWLPSAPTINVGEAVFVRKAAAGTWTQTFNIQ